MGSGRQFVSADEVEVSAPASETLLKTLRFSQSAVGSLISLIVVVVEVTASSGGSLKLLVNGSLVAQAPAPAGETVLSGPLPLLVTSPYTVELRGQNCTIGLTEVLVEA